MAVHYNPVDLEAFGSNTTESTELRLVRPAKEDGASMRYAEFNPEFTYSIFGEQEVAFGYKDLAIQLYFASGSLATYFHLEYSEKFQGVSSSSSGGDTVTADDIEGKLREFIPHDYTTNYDQFIDTVKEDEKSFRPHGEKVHEYSLNDGKDRFEIYKASFSSEKFRKYHEHIQLFMLLYVEGSSYIDAEDDKWNIYTLYKRVDEADDSSFHFVGYATLYPFFCWPDKIRMRISQFLILPPFQQSGHGSILYNTIYKEVAARADVVEMNVEDPNENFSDLRDKNDVRMLTEANAFEGIKAPVSDEFVETMRKRFKLTKRQTQRCIEIYLLQRLDKRKAMDYKNYRLQVKARLYKFNFDALRDMEQNERLEKLQETYKGVEEDYHRIIELI
ncbi:histone acetyltransferase 1 [Umbelopsis nana]